MNSCPTKVADLMVQIGFSAFLSAMVSGFPTRVSLMRISRMARMVALEAWVRDTEGASPPSGRRGACTDTREQAWGGEGDGGDDAGFV